jgi:hypothetical protein
MLNPFDVLAIIGMAVVVTAISFPILEAVRALIPIIFEGGGELPPQTSKDRWVLAAVLLVAFGGGVFVHPLFLITLYGWAAWSNYQERGSIFRQR